VIDGALVQQLADELAAAAGPIVLPGAVHASVPRAPGDVVTATGPTLGSASLRVGPAAAVAA